MQQYMTGLTKAGKRKESSIHIYCDMAHVVRQTVNTNELEFLLFQTAWTLQIMAFNKTQLNYYIFMKLQHVI
jgi:hypothetical protein